MKFNLPEGFSNRREAIESLLKEEKESAQAALCDVRSAVKDLLLGEKGYAIDEIETDCEFDVSTGSGPAKSKMDFVVRINGKRLVSIKCAADALVSRQRQALAGARLLDSYQVPLAVITDSVGAIVLDTVTGEVIGEGLDAVPPRHDLLKTTERTNFSSLPEEKIEREKRIAAAFDVIEG